jgi:hypothetical protein
LKIQHIDEWSRATHIHSSIGTVNREKASTKIKVIEVFNILIGRLEFNAFSRENAAVDTLVRATLVLVLIFDYLIEYVGGHFLSLVTLIYTLY